MSAAVSVTSRIVFSVPARSRRGLTGIWRRALIGLALLMVQPGFATAQTVGEGLNAYRAGDYDKARDIWAELAEDGNPTAQFNLGILYDEGRGVDRDPVRARELWNAAAQSGLMTARHNLALASLEGAKDTESLKSAIGDLNRVAETGYAPSLYTLGKLLMTDIGQSAGLPDDPAKAADLISRAAEAGHTAAAYNMGKLYRDGVGVAPDPEKAAAWFRRAALQGHAGAQDHYARRLATGDGVPQDRARALAFALLAARQDYDGALELAEDLKDSMDIMDIAAAVRFADQFRPRTGQAG